jgi:hypothetical protein
MKRIITIFVIILSALIFSNNTQAQKGFYIGGSLGPSFINQVILDIDSIQIELQENELSYKFYAGWRMTKFFAFEGGYRNLGKSTQELSSYKLDAKTDGWDFQALGIFPLGPLDLFGKLGVFFWDSEYKFNDELLYKNGTSFMFGLGAGVRLGRLGLRAEWEFLDLSKGNRLSMLTAGATVKIIKMGN